MAGLEPLEARRVRTWILLAADKVIHGLAFFL